MSQTATYYMLEIGSTSLSITFSNEDGLNFLLSEMVRISGSPYISEWS